MRKTEVKLKIRNYHSDNHNHVNNARYLEFFKEGSWDFLEKNKNVGKLMKTLAEDSIVHVAYRRMYETRHTFASWALAAGETPEWVARTLGHVDTSMVYQTYGRFIPNLTRKDGSAFEQQLDNNTKKI